MGGSRPRDIDWFLSSYSIFKIPCWVVHICFEMFSIEGVHAYRKFTNKIYHRFLESLIDLTLVEKKSIIISSLTKTWCRYTTALRQFACICLFYEYECEWCSVFGKFGPMKYLARVVHHIIRVKSRAFACFGLRFC